MSALITTFMVAGIWYTLYHILDGSRGYHTRTHSLPHCAHTLRKSSYYPVSPQIYIADTSLAILEHPPHVPRSTPTPKPHNDKTRNRETVKVYR